MIATIYDLGSVHYPWRWALRCDYNPELVAALKDQIHYRQRKWVPEELRWWFHDEVNEDVLLLAERYCGRVRHAEAQGRTSSAPSIPANLVAAYHVLYLAPNAPDDYLKAAYRVACKLHHPDAGGMTRDMQRVNEAYDLIVRARQKGETHR